MSRNLVICFDGTNNQFGPQNTSVVRLVQVLDRDPTKQRLYYDPGVGTLPEGGLLAKVATRLSGVFGLALGYGLTTNVEEAYSYLMEIWEPGDQVFLFGFSRGAYTARVLAGLLHALGLLPRGNENLVPYVLRLFASVRNVGHEEDADNAQYWDLCREFRWTFARPFRVGDDERRFRVHFLGVWDTVSSVGWAWDPARFPYTARNPSIDVIRHAVSIDERRWFFRQNQMVKTGAQDFAEQWFPGVHSDVGGGYPEADGGLWRLSFDWMRTAAERAGLRIDAQRLDEVLHRTEPSPRPWTDRQHESLTPLWWPAEFFPKLPAGPGSFLRLPRFGLGRNRCIEDNALINRAALLRIREKAGYAPRNLSRTFLQKIRDLPEVPEAMPFER